MKETTIMLCCAAGMSTSLLVANMQKAAEKKGDNTQIFACSISEADKNLAEEDIDCVLLGPQVKYVKGDFEQKLEGRDIPLAVIDMQAYGMVDGAKVLQQAYDLMDV